VAGLNQENSGLFRQYSISGPAVYNKVMIPQQRCSLLKGRGLQIKCDHLPCRANRSRQPASVSPLAGGQVNSQFTREQDFAGKQLTPGHNAYQGW
jgi:hypothetical protein